jgi:hypothetical protein
MRILSTIMRLGLLVAAAASAVSVTGCGPSANGSAIIHYDQVGACTGFVTDTGEGSNVGQNAAYVVFKVISIDDSAATVPFNFDPGSLYVGGDTSENFQSTLAIYSGLFHQLAVTKETVPPGKSIIINEFGAAVVSTNAADGVSEASQASYFLNYETQPGDPGVALVKDNATQTSWLDSPDCRSIPLK